MNNSVAAEEVKLGKRCAREAFCVETLSFFL